MPYWNSKYKDKGLVVLGVNTADARQIALDYLNTKAAPKSDFVRICPA